MSSHNAVIPFPRMSVGRVALGFAVGAVAIVLCHQPMLALLTAVGLSAAETFSWRPTDPFGVPRLLSLGFWGGLWGILFVLIEPPPPRKLAYWIIAFAFGAVIPTLVGWFVVAPLRGLTPAGDWSGNRVLSAFLVNGAWGLGAAALLAIAGSRSAAQRRLARDVSDRDPHYRSAGPTRDTDHRG